ncbi:PASTA domain-containing protein [Vulcanimicrobium alpinum]|uniref:PASTA domain-containing protein n=1 Tax=Vulcanimicrobium alpinum TaxID=3016050 RepID=UPI00295F0258|nr:PASTA domain-containing protein [Vulcanimicrobium alpinum]
MLTAIAAALVFAIVWAGTRTPAIALADVRRTQVLHARAALAARGLVSSAVERPDVAVPAGSVIDQQPIAGTAVHRGDRVRLVVSSGPPLVTVPEPRGRSYAEARAALARLPLASTFEARISGAPADTVLAEDPQPGAHVKPGSAEMVVISTGPQPAFDGYGGYDPGAGPAGRQKHGRFAPGAGENGGGVGGD